MRTSDSRASWKHELECEVAEFRRLLLLFGTAAIAIEHLFDYVHYV